MSHSSGQIIKDGKIVAHYEYNGTSDIAIPALYESNEEMAKHWRNQPWKKCECPEPKGEPVTIYSNYGFGFHWPGRACLKCMAITEGMDPFEHDDRIDGHPLHPCGDCGDDGEKPSRNCPTCKGSGFKRLK